MLIKYVSLILKTLHLPTYCYELCSVLPCVSVSVWNYYWHVFVYFSSSSRVTKLGVTRAVEQPGCRRCRHRHHLATICTLPSPSYLSYLWHGTIMYLTHTHLSSQRRILALILSLVPSLLSQKSLACSESPDLNFIKSLLFMNHESFICKLWSFARNTVFLGHPISDLTLILLKYYPKSSCKYKAVSPL